MVGCFGFNSSFRQKLSQYRAVPQRERERVRETERDVIGERKKQPPTLTYIMHALKHSKINCKYRILCIPSHTHTESRARSTVNIA